MAHNQRCHKVARRSHQPDGRGACGASRPCRQSFRFHKQHAARRHTKISICPYRIIASQTALAEGQVDANGRRDRTIRPRRLFGLPASPQRAQAAKVLFGFRGTRRESQITQDQSAADMVARGRRRGESGYRGPSQSPGGWSRRFSSSRHGAGAPRSSPVSKA